MEEKKKKRIFWWSIGVLAGYAAVAAAFFFGADLFGRGAVGDIFIISFLFFPIVFWLWAPIAARLLVPEDRRSALKGITIVWMLPWAFFIISPIFQASMRAPSCPALGKDSIAINILSSNVFAVGAWIVLLLLPATALYFLIVRNVDRRQDTEYLRRWLAVMMIFAVFFAFWVSSFVKIHDHHHRAADARRIADLRTTQISLGAYFVEHDSYPRLAGWESLERELLTFGVMPPNDPCRGREGYEDLSYEYVPGNCSGGACFSYVLRTMLADPKSAGEVRSVRGEIFGLDCESPYYCVSL